MTLSPSALRTTSLVYPGSLNPIAGCAQNHSHGESHPSTHSHHSPASPLWEAPMESRRTEVLGDCPQIKKPLRLCVLYPPAEGCPRSRCPAAMPRMLAPSSLSRSISASYGASLDWYGLPPVTTFPPICQPRCCYILETTSRIKAKRCEPSPQKGMVCPHGLTGIGLMRTVPCMAYN